MFQLADEFIDILPAPLVPFFGFVAFPVGAETVVVRKGYPVHGIGIEVIVHVNGVHVIAAHDVFHDPANVLPASGYARIEK